MIDLGEIKYSILYVDDEQVNLDVFKSTFRWYYTVHTALSGKEGLEILEKEKIDMVITDQKMPGMSGVEFLKKIIPSYPDQVRIILTGYSDIEAIAYAINEVGIYQYIQKPWDADEMRHILNKALKQYQLSLDNKQLLIDLKVANEELKQINENLEEKVKERTAEVNLQKVELEEKNEKITSSINYAKRIQNSMLPPIEKVCGSFSDAFVYFRPRDIVSGDFYWHQCDGNRTVIAAVDCTGHGVPGAFMSLVGSELLNKIVNYKQIYDAAKILTELHIEIRSVLKQETSENRDGMDMSLVVIDREKKTIQFS
ncbi:MAG: response regulator, partial [Cyclobacteriaceae bacterium]|nr:response regulator [Cyclobacteriaceae bacterium]